MILMNVKGKFVGGVALAVGLALGTAGCGAGEPASDDSVKVVASFYPLAYVAEQIGGPAVEVQNLTAPGAEPHELELTPRQVAELASADLVVYESGFQPAVDAAVEQQAPPQTLDATAVIAEPSGSELAQDPHFWLDPTKLATVAAEVTESLAGVAPDQSDEIRQRSQDFTDRLAALDEELMAGLARCERRVFVTSHEAFGHLAARYDLQMVGISGLDPEAEPSPARVAEVREIAEREQVTTIFYETLVSPEVAEVIANDLGLVTDVLDPIEGLTSDNADEDYFSLMRANLEALMKANGCR